MTTPRQESADSGHHLTVRSLDGRLVIVTSLCAGEYLGRFAEVCIQRGWIVITYCVMGNHVHVVCWTPNADLGKGMKVVQESFAHYANARDGKRGRGHFWSRRFRNQPIVTEDHAVAALRYVARQPEHHQVSTIDAWRPSAHHALLGTEACPEWLQRDRALAMVGGVEAYAALVAKDDRTMTAELLEAFGPAEGVRRAIDVHGIAPVVVLQVGGLSERTFYRRLSDGRAAHRVASLAGLPLGRA